MSADTFDPTEYASAAECVQALKEQGVQVGHRLGARIFGLGRKGVRFSLAFLEEADVLLDPAWNDVSGPEDARRLLDGQAALVEEAGVLHVLTPDEYVPESALATRAPQGSILPAVLGAQDVSGFHGVLWDRKRMEEAALTLLDAEDPKELLEAFRYLFRATTACGQDPTSLLVTAFRRGRMELSREAANLVRDTLNRDFGRALRDLLSDDPGQIRNALHFFTSDVSRQYTAVLHAVLLPALTPLIVRPEFRALLLPKLPQLAPLVGTEAGPMESFLDAVLNELPELELNERFAVSAFMADLGDRYPGLPAYLLRRVAGTADPHLVAFYGNVLSRLRLEPEQHEEVVRRMAALFQEHGRDTALSRRLRATFRILGAGPLARLSDPAFTRGLAPEQRTWLVHLWKDYRQAEGPLPAEGVFVRFALEEILSRNRGSLLALVRTGQLALPALRDALRELEEPRAPVFSYLLDEAYRMEDPDDVPVLDLLASVGPEVLDRAFAFVREEAALESGGEAGRLILFGRLASRLDLGPRDRERLRAMVRELLSFSFLHPDALPAVWAGVGEVGSIPGLGQELQAELADRLGQPLDRYPQARVDALLQMYPACEVPVRRQIESLLRGVLTQEGPDRKVLRASLEGLERLLLAGPLLLDAEPLVMDLCRTVLWKGQEESLEQVLLQALSETAVGDGVQMPTAWSKEDRDLSLRILGAVACHPDTPERLHRMVVVRLFSFLADWLDAVERARDLYAYRETPLWEILRRLLECRPGEQGLPLARDAALRLLEVHRRRPDGLALARRENAQRFLLTLVRLDRDGEVLVRGVAVDLARTLLRTLMDLALSAVGENKVTEYLLDELARARVLPDAMQRELEGFLARIAP